jgi:5'(3')-deoxyribonucleotidase
MKIVFLDMDGVLADFDGAIPPGSGWDPPEMFVVGFFRNLKVMPGAKQSVAKLLENPDLEVYIGSKPTTKNLHSFTEKAEWIEEHFPALLKSMVLVCDKKLLHGDILIDDDLERWSPVFDGQFIHFDRHNPEQSWGKIVEELCGVKS